LAEILQLALADNLHAPFVDVVREARERETELLDARRGDAARLGPARSREEAEPEVRRRAGDERADGDGRILAGVLRRRIHFGRRSTKKASAPKAFAPEMR
jgi:hypothetical protein